MQQLKPLLALKFLKFLTKTFCNFLNDNFLYAKAKIKEPIAPIPAASVGVAKPNSILPNAAKTNAAGGTSPKKNSIQTALMLVALNSSGKTGPKLGSIQHLIVV